MKPEHLLLAGAFAIFAGFMLIALAAFFSTESGGKPKIAFGGFIGFIPFGFGNDKQLMWGIMALTALVAIIWFFLQLQIRNP